MLKSDVSPMSVFFYTGRYPRVSQSRAEMSEVNVHLALRADFGHPEDSPGLFHPGRGLTYNSGGMPSSGTRPLSVQRVRSREQKNLSEVRVLVCVPMQISPCGRNWLLQRRKKFQLPFQRYVVRQAVSVFRETVDGRNSFPSDVSSCPRGRHGQVEDHP